MTIKKTFAIGLFTLFYLASCEKQDDLYSLQNPMGPQIGGIIAFKSVSGIQVDADSFSLCTVTVKINPEAVTPNRTITFKVSGGARFTNGDTSQVVTANTEGLATVAFRNPKPETVQLKAAISNFSIDTIVSFMSVLPDDMILTAERYNLDSSTSESAIVNVKLYRNAGRGQVTDGAKVQYSVVALDTTGLNLVLPGSFQYSVSQQVVFSLQNPYKIGGRFNITATTKAADGTNISQTVPIRIR